jgi:GABA(A) receptor-associated protein
MSGDYKIKKSFEERKIESYRILCKYINYTPIIVEKYDKKSIDLDKYKFLVPSDFTIGQFLYVLRKNLKLSPEKAMFCFINNTLPHTSANINDIYDKYKDEDGFLYVTYSTEESVFG